MANYYVYFIASTRPHKRGRGTCTPVKIGFSKNPEERLATLQTGNPSALKLSAMILCKDKAESMRLEAALHSIAEKRFKRLAGEWFLIYGSFKKLIEQAMLAAGIAAEPVATPDRARKIEEGSRRRAEANDRKILAELAANGASCDLMPSSFAGHERSRTRLPLHRLAAFIH